MKALMVIEVDDERFKEHVEDVWEDVTSSDMGALGPKPTAEQYFLNRLEEVCQDEMPVTLWGWTERFGLQLNMLLGGDVVVVLSDGEAHALLERPEGPVAAAATEKIRMAVLST